MARQVEASGSRTLQSAAKRQRMGPQECMQYSNTSTGAAALTNPHLVVRSGAEPRQIPMPFQRGRTQGGSGFIPSNQPGYASSSQGSNHVRQYVSPSKSQPLPPSGDGKQVYDRSGFTCIGLGSPYKKVFNQRGAGHSRSASYPQSKRGLFSEQRPHASGSQSSNSWKQRTNSPTGNHVTAGPSSRSSSNETFGPSVSNSQFAKRKTSDPASTDRRDLKTPSSVSGDSKSGIISGPYSPGKMGHFKARGTAMSYPYSGPQSTSRDAVSPSLNGLGSSHTRSPQRGNQLQKSSVPSTQTASNAGGSQFSKRKTPPNPVSPVTSSQFSKKRTAGSSAKSPVSHSRGAEEAATLPKNLKYSVSPGGTQFVQKSSRNHGLSPPGSQFARNGDSGTASSPRGRSNTSQPSFVRDISPRKCDSSKSVSKPGGSQFAKKIGRNSLSPQGSQFVRNRDLDTATGLQGKSHPSDSSFVNEGGSSRNGSPPQRSQFVRCRNPDSTTHPKGQSSTHQQGFASDTSPCASKTANSAASPCGAVPRSKVSPLRRKSSHSKADSSGEALPRKSTNHQFSPRRSPMSKQVVLPKYMGTTPTKSVDGRVPGQSHNQGISSPGDNREVPSQKQKPSVKRDLNQVWNISGTNKQFRTSPRSASSISTKPAAGTSSTLLRFKPKSRSTSSPSSAPVAPSASPTNCGQRSQFVKDEESKVCDINSMEREPSSSQGSTEGCDLSSLSVLSQPDSLAESLEAFENDSVEDLLEDYDLAEDGTLVASQPSVASDETPDNLLEGIENDPIEKPSTVNGVGDDGRVVHPQPSSTSQGSLFCDPEGMVVCVKKEKEEETESNSSEESVALFLRTLRSDDEDSTRDSDDDDGDDSDTECHLLSHNSIVDGHRTDTQNASTSSQLSGTIASTSFVRKPTGSDEVNYEDMIDDEEIPEELLERLEAGHVIDQVPLKGRTFGLVGDERDDEMEVEEERDFFEALPVEVMENIFCRIPILDLMQSCARVCQRWRDVITDASFIPWKKSYTKCKSGKGQWVSPLAGSTQESCLLDLIRYLSTVRRVPGVSTTGDLQQHPKYGFARDMIAENLPDLVKDGVAHPWSLIAALVILAETVADVKDIMTCLLHPQASNSPLVVTEVLYCVATLLLDLQRQHNLCRRLHYRVFYALFLYENDVSPSSIVLIGNTPERPTRVANGRTSFPLTQEQRRIVNHQLDRNNRNEVIKVVAFAGTGKTTTLIKFAEANMYLHLLYVAFNKSVQIEASRTFPGNTECRTSHSLAYDQLKAMYKRKLCAFGLSPHNVHDLLPERPKHQKSSLHHQLYARLVADSLNAYMSSADELITTRHVPEEYSTLTKPPAPLLHHDRMRLLKDAEYLWKRMIDPEDMDAKITHDGYFKVYQLSKPVISDIDCMLIDEAQDLTPAQQDVLLSQTVPKILVGDPNQQIYSFRGARNAMSAVEADRVFHLTQSFRFGSEIAYMAHCILDVFKNMTEHTVVGKEEDGTLRGEHVGQLAIICRGNGTIFREAVRLVTTTPQGTVLRLGFTTDGGLHFGNLMDLYKMSCGAGGRSINNLFYRKYTFASIEAYANNALDNELMGLISIVKLYHHSLPDYVDRIKAKTVKKLEYATIVLTTAHKSKGLEFDTVQVTDDFLMFGPAIVQTENGILITENVRIPEDEKNLIYVAATRAKKSLYLNSGLRKCLQKASDLLKFPFSTKLFLEGDATLEERRCLECGQPIITQERVTMLKVWSIKLGSSTRGTQQQHHPAQNGGYICSRCAHHHMRGFERIFLGDRVAPRAAEMEVDVPIIQ